MFYNLYLKCLMSFHLKRSREYSKQWFTACSIPATAVCFGADFVDVIIFACSRGSTNTHIFHVI